MDLLLRIISNRFLTDLKEVIFDQCDFNNIDGARFFEFMRDRKLENLEILSCSNFRIPIGEFKESLISGFRGTLKIRTMPVGVPSLIHYQYITLMVGILSSLSSPTDHSFLGGIIQKLIPEEYALKDAVIVATLARWLTMTPDIRRTIILDLTRCQRNISFASCFFILEKTIEPFNLQRPPDNKISINLGFGFQEVAKGYHVVSISADGKDMKLLFAQCQ